MELLQSYYQIRKKSEEMCFPLEIEDYIPQSIFFVSPPKWNIAHTSWFFEEFILKNYLADYKPLHPLYSYLFNSYYEGAGKRVSRDERGSLSRPTVKEVYAYRNYVDEHMARLLEPKISDEIRDLVILGLNHEQQHQELFLTDHKYALSRNPLYPAYSKKPLAELGSMPEQKWVNIEGGLKDVGHDGKGFSYDNECPVHKVFIEPFDISSRLVSNGEFIAFIESGGYDKYEFWHDEGWRWRKENDIKAPMYWNSEKDWKQFTLAGMRKINPDHPLTHISYYEAFAYAQWKGARLPTEFEWELAADSILWGDRWEWTESAYLPYPGYKKASGTVGEYNGKFMVNQKVLRGSSVATPAGHSRKTYRNFFHPHLSWQFNGIRLVK